jgi:hypothetical protein
LNHIVEEQEINSYLGWDLMHVCISESENYNNNLQANLILIPEQKKSLIDNILVTLGQDQRRKNGESY